MAGEKGKMSVAEAGRKGGEKTAQKYGEGYYERIGRLGGLKIKQLIAAGKAAEQDGSCCRAKDDRRRGNTT